MSMITEQVKRLRSEAAGMILQNGTTARLLREAADTIETLSAKVRKENGFIFPENPTNGDMILTMFDTATVYGIDEEKDCIAICIDNNFYQKFRYSWWNSQYERGETE